MTNKDTVESNHGQFCFGKFSSKCGECEECAALENQSEEELTK